MYLNYKAWNELIISKTKIHTSKINLHLVFTFLERWRHNTYFIILLKSSFISIRNLYKLCFKKKLISSHKIRDWKRRMINCCSGVLVTDFIFFQFYNHYVARGSIILNVGIRCASSFEFDWNICMHTVYMLWKRTKINTKFSCNSFFSLFLFNLAFFQL